MKINSKSVWQRTQIDDFLTKSTMPVRISFVDSSGHPRICSLWYRYDNGAIWSASHQNAFLIKQLKKNQKVAFEISSNDYPYKGVRGKALATLVKSDAEPVLKALIAKYLGESNKKLASWLVGRADEEYAIKLVPESVNAWDFSDRMEN